MEKLKSLSYFRDLGGITTKDGNIVKKDVIFRCCDFTKISREDEELLRNNFYACIDLRAEDEVIMKPECFKDDSFYHHFPMLTNEENPAVTKETRTAILKRRMSEPGGMKGHITQLYRRIVNSERSRKYIKKIFNLLLNKDKEGIVAYHCTQGKDRTGMVSVSILLALGVDKEDIIKDYLGYNKHERFKRFMIQVGITTWQLSFKTGRELNSALIAIKRYINAAFDEMDKLFGGSDGYLRTGLGLTDEDLAKLKKLYLNKA
ncbi:MAG: tyrosine-protein phosphatase [Bacilli bacterium]|nr:tyrosine-protein phosphatase [Bacilli bacterium]